MASVYALPISSSSQMPSTSRNSPRKRKRKIADTTAEGKGNASLVDEASEAEEYAAVLAPNERAQRRLAGHSLVKDLPVHPFPHRAPRPRSNPTEATDTEGQVGVLDPLGILESHNDVSASLRVQHLSSMSAVLHKSLLKKDYARARRALGLILRSDVHGTPIDIRAAGNWGVGAEILFRQYDHLSGLDPSIKTHHERRRRGFAEAKDLYEMLIVQYPFHRSRPESVNAIDFYLAMFSLWIYVAQAEGQDMLNHLTRDDGQVLDSFEQAEVRRQELRAANEIGARMDKCMAATPFSDNRDLLRLRAMVAEWQADLNDDLENTASETVINADDEPHMGLSVAARNPGLTKGDSIAQHIMTSSTRAREKAKTIYERIGRPHSAAD